MVFMDQMVCFLIFATVIDYIHVTALLHSSVSFLTLAGCKDWCHSLARTDAEHPEIPPNVHVITQFADIITGVAPHDTLPIFPTKLGRQVLAYCSNGEVGEISRLRQSGDKVKFFPPCVELLGKIWALRFKYRVQIYQSSVLDVTEDEDIIQTITSTISLQMAEIEISQLKYPSNDTHWNKQFNVHTRPFFLSRSAQTKKRELSPSTHLAEQSHSKIMNMRSQ
ncbi:hypothetical protein JHK85_000829 [Glycine max]|nr:hypothetical protein JHK85_000829 [Glycine max]